MLEPVHKWVKGVIVFFGPEIFCECTSEIDWISCHQIMIFIATYKIQHNLAYCKKYETKTRF